jgi:hypothetical protein
MMDVILDKFREYVEKLEKSRRPARADAADDVPRFFTNYH